MNAINDADAPRKTAFEANKLSKRLHRQFGQGFARLRKFREKFLTVLRHVQEVYPAAKVQPTGRGLLMRQSAPPVPYREARRLAKA